VVKNPAKNHQKSILTHFDQKKSKRFMQIFGFGSIADTEYSVSVETNYLAEYLAETRIWSTTII
jgi:hypothetical protein